MGDYLSRMHANMQMLEVIDSVWDDARADAGVFTLLKRLRGSVASKLDPPKPLDPPIRDSDEPPKADPDTTASKTAGSTDSSHFPLDFSTMTLRVPTVYFPAYLLSRTSVFVSKPNRRRSKLTPLAKSRRLSPRGGSALKTAKPSPPSKRTHALLEAYLVEPATADTPLLRATPLAKSPLASATTETETIVEATLEPDSEPPAVPAQVRLGSWC